MIDQLSQRVFDLEQGVGPTTQFHTVKPDDVDASFAHVSTDMGKHTAPRPDPTHVTPEKTEPNIKTYDDLKPEDFHPGTATKQQKVVSPDTSMGDEGLLLTEPKSSGKKPKANKTFMTADQIKDMVEARKIQFK